MLETLLAIQWWENGWFKTDPLMALLFAVIGFVFVFVGIGILIGVLYLVGYLMKKSNGNLLNLLPKKKVAEVKSEKVEEKTAPVVQNNDVSEEEIAAVMAAIMAYYSVEKPKCEFVVKKIKRI